jgi:hypothetical protein
MGWRAPGLVGVAVLATGLMLIAAVNLALVFVLFSSYPQAGRPDTGLSNFVVPMALGAFPFLITAGLIAWTLLGARAATQAGKPTQQSRLALISGIGLPFILLCGFWVGLSASAQELPVGSAAAAALTVYQFTLLGAVIADGLTLVLALVTRGTGHLPRDASGDR